MKVLDAPVKQTMIAPAAVDGSAAVKRLVVTAVVAAAPHPAPAHHAGHHRGGMHHGFQHAEEWAKVFDDPARDAWQQPDRVIAALELTPAMAVADVGAGTGYFAVRLARAVPEGQILATDVEPDMIRYLTDRAAKEQLPNLRAALTPTDDPLLAPASLDRILVVDVWHHLEDRVAYARHLAAALRPGGRLAVVDFKLDADAGSAEGVPHRAGGARRRPGRRRARGPRRAELPEQYVIVGVRSRPTATSGGPAAP